MTFFPFKIVMVPPTRYCLFWGVFILLFLSELKLIFLLWGPCPAWCTTLDHDINFLFPFDGVKVCFDDSESCCKLRCCWLRLLEVILEQTGRLSWSHTFPSLFSWTLVFSIWTASFLKAGSSGIFMLVSFLFSPAEANVLSLQRVWFSCRLKTVIPSLLKTGLSMGNNVKLKQERKTKSKPHTEHAYLNFFLKNTHKRRK